MTVADFLAKLVALLDTLKRLPGVAHVRLTVDSTVAGGPAVMFTFYVTDNLGFRFAGTVPMPLNDLALMRDPDGWTAYRFEELLSRIKNLMARPAVEMTED